MSSAKCLSQTNSNLKTNMADKLLWPCRIPTVN